VNQISPDLGIPNRFSLNSSGFSSGFLVAELAAFGAANVASWRISDIARCPLHVRFPGDCVAKLDDFSRLGSAVSH